MEKHIKSNQKAEKDRWYSVWSSDVHSLCVTHIPTPLQISSPKLLNHYFALNLNFSRPKGLVAHVSQDVLGLRHGCPQTR